MNLDEIVAQNVTRLREDKSPPWSVAELAKLLGVSRHRVYDYERPRKGAQQRPFLWQEIVNLCGVFNVTIFELVLPEKGQRSVPAGWEHLPLVIPSFVEAEGSDEMKAHWRQDDRGRLLEILIGPGFEPEHIDALNSMKARREEQLITELKNLLREKGAGE
jgi:hypothetical protein